MLHVAQNFFDDHKHPMLVFDPLSQKVLKANAAACDFFACPSEALLSKDIVEVLRSFCGAPKRCISDIEKDPDVHISDATFENNPAKLVTLYKTLPLEDPHEPTARNAETRLSAEALKDRCDHLAARLRQTESLANIGNWEVNWETSTVRWSRKNFEIFGLQAETFDGPPPDIATFVHPEDKPAFDLAMDKVRDTGEAFASVHRIIRSNGEMRYVSMSGETLNDGGARTFYGITQDITDTYMAQIAANKTVALLADAGEIAKVGSWEYDGATGIISRSSIVAEIVGSPEQLTISLEQARALYSPAFIERHKAMWDDCLRQGTAFDEVMELASTKGDRKWVRISGTAVWNSDRTKITSICGALQDISEVVSARQQTKAMSARLEETLEGVSDSFMILNRQWEITFANESAAKMMELPRSDMLGENVWTLFPEAVGSKFQKRYERLMAEGGTQRFIEQSPRSGKWLSVSAYSTSHGIAISSRDVSDEYARDQQLRLLEAAVSRLNDIVMIAGAEPVTETSWEKFVFANEAFERITGYSTDYAIGKTAEFLRGPGTQVEEIARMKNAVRNQEPFRTELVNYTKTGEPIWLDLDVIPIKQDDGAVTHWVSVARDITERKESDQRIHLSEERFRLVAAASNDVIWDCDLGSGQMWWNDKLTTVFGYDPAEFTDKLSWWDVNLHPEEQDEILDRMQSIIDGSDEFWEMHYRFRKADGSYAHVRDKGSVLRDENGVATRILGNMTDITERLHLEEQLRQSQKMEAIGKLTGGVAHDFNNLLAIIMGNLELLKEEMRLNERPPMDAYDLIDAGISAVKRGSDLTNQMLAYARKARLAPVDTDLNLIVNETESWVRRTIDSKIEIKTDLVDTLWKTRVDPNSLQNAIVNLLLNARDALGDGGKIVIKTRNVARKDPRVTQNNLPASRHGFVMLSIRDDGSGITPDDLEHVFDPFFTTKPVGKGSGLGLSMVQGFVSQSDGAIRVFSKPGRGTTFELYFKADPSQEQQLPNRPDQRSARPERQRQAPELRRILLVEDEPEVQRMLERTLSNNGYEITTADDGDHALEIFTRDPDFDLILTDISMPGNLDGFDLAKACRRMKSDVAIILLSGHASDNSMGHEAEIPDGLRLMKPVSQHELLTAVRQKVETPLLADIGSMM